MCLGYLYVVFLRILILCYIYSCYIIWNESWLVDLLHLYSLVSIECVGEMQDFLGKGNELFAVCVRHWAILENIHAPPQRK